MRHRPLVGLALVAVGLAATPVRSAPIAQTVRVKETNFKITLSAKPRPGRVRFVVTNASSIVHDLWVRGGGVTVHTKLIRPGKTAVLVATLKKGVTYRIWCAVDAHAKLGMDGRHRVQ